MSKDPNVHTVYLLCGLIGSGKSTWAKKKAEEDNVIIINRDSIRKMIKGKYVFNQKYESFIRASCYDILTTALDYGFDIIIDETNIRKSKRSDWKDLIYISAKDRGVEVKIVLVYFTEKEKNVDNRMTSSKGQSRKVWEKVYQSMLADFEQPTLNELPEGSVIIEVSI